MVKTRREVMAGLASVGAATWWKTALGQTGGGRKCPFRLAVITDEISQDLDHACEVAAKEFGLEWVELRGMWGKSATDLNAKEIDDVKAILAKNRLRVTDIASPLFKTDWPGAPRSAKSQKRDTFHADSDAHQQEKLLEKCIVLAKAFGTDRIRCFDYWRLQDVAPYRKAINDKLREAARRCAQENLILLLENEMSCNTATGAEAATVLGEISEKNFMLNWDPGNAAAIGETPYPDGYDLLPKDRIGHCHAKSVFRKPGGKYEWAPVGKGVVDWVGQLRALDKDGFRKGLSLETHWRGGGTPEESTRISMKGLKGALAEAGIPFNG